MANENGGSGGARPGGRGPGGAGGFGFGKGRGGERGRDGGRFPARGGGRDSREGSAGGHRVVGELSGLEKALSTADYTKQRTSLQDIVKALRPLRLKSIDDLDLNTRGRLITTLMRVSRQSPPKAAPPGEASASAAAPAEAPAAEGAQAPAAEASASEGGEVAADAPAADAAPSEGTAAQEAAATSLAEKKPEDKLAAYQDVMFQIGEVWRAAGDEPRAEVAYQASGRGVPEKSANVEPAPRPSREAEARPSRERGPRPPRGERPTREPREPRPAPFVSSGDWQKDAQQLEAQKRTRDAARIHERNNSFADASRLFEAGGDLKSALRASIAGKDNETSRRLVAALSPLEARQVLEKAGAYELLMEHYVAAGDFENVARLYERARQFDQAALAWERAGKLSQARKAYERARDASGAARVRDLEVSKLIERGDRLGAALLHLNSGQKDKAVETLEALPPPKAYRFLQKAKLEAEAAALAQRELAKAVEAQRPGDQARWLEMTEDFAGAAEAWERADRKEKAVGMYDQAGQVARAAALAESLQLLDRAQELFKKAGDEGNAARVAALPRPPPPEPKPAETSSPQGSGAEVVPPDEIGAAPSAEVPS